MLTVITGPMFSGKTERLISIGTAHHYAEHIVKAFKPANDDRYDETFITSHAQNKWLAVPINPKKPKGIADKIYEQEDVTSRRVDVVLIDEAQFFDAEDLIFTIEHLLYIDERTIILSGLSQDSEGRPFGAMPHLLAIADDIVHLKSVCAKSKCVGTATRTFRKDETNKNQVAVGGAEMYEPRSFKEWLQGT